MTVFAVLVFSTVVDEADGEGLGEWLKKNEPRVVAYLESLSAEDIGHALPGVELSDGKRELEGYVYKGRTLTTRPRTHAYRFGLLRGDSNYEIHYIWIDAGGDPLDSVACAGTWIEPGGYAVLSGDVCTQGKILPGDLVITTCKLSGHAERSE